METKMTHFEPRDQKEHERANRDRDVPDYCKNCEHPFMDHYNGQCPQDEEESE